MWPQNQKSTSSKEKGSGEAKPSNEWCTISTSLYCIMGYVLRNDTDKRRKASMKL